MTATVLNAKVSEVENKILDASSLVQKTVLNIKIGEVENKFSNNSKNFTTQEFNKLTAESFAARLKQVDIVNKTDFDNKRTSFNRGTTSNKVKHLKVQKKQNSLITNDHNLFLGSICFTSNDGS